MIVHLVKWHMNDDRASSKMAPIFKVGLQGVSLKSPTPMLKSNPLHFVLGRMGTKFAVVSSMLGETHSFLAPDKFGDMTALLLFNIYKFGHSSMYHVSDMFDMHALIK